MRKVVCVCVCVHVCVCVCVIDHMLSSVNPIRMASLL